MRGDHAVVAQWLTALRLAQEGSFAERDIMEMKFLTAFLKSPEGQAMVRSWPGTSRDPTSPMP